ncbi:MAG: hypothetical protein NT154_08265 [Verrucomicrobia bacterium]|nr:hypothetical protein [Verrucomicrobiota bacterium]
MRATLAILLLSLGLAVGAGPGLPYYVRSVPIDCSLIYDTFEAYPTNYSIGGFNGGFSCYAQTPYATHPGMPELRYDIMEWTNYVAGATVAGLTNGVDWETAYAAHISNLGLWAADDMESYSASVSLDGLNGVYVIDGRGTNFAGAYASH